MQASTQLTIPRFSPAVVMNSQPLWEVALRVHAKRFTWGVRYFAQDADAAARAALADARNKWKGHTFAVLSVVQVQA